jgi:hypothetical protein
VSELDRIWFRASVAQHVLSVFQGEPAEMGLVENVLGVAGPAAVALLLPESFVPQHVPEADDHGGARRQQFGGRA